MDFFANFNNYNIVHAYYYCRYTSPSSSRRAVRTWREARAAAAAVRPRDRFLFYCRDRRGFSVSLSHSFFFATHLLKRYKNENAIFFFRPAYKNVRETTTRLRWFFFFILSTTEQIFRYHSKSFFFSICILFQQKHVDASHEYRHEFFVFSIALRWYFFSNITEPPVEKENYFRWNPVRRIYYNGTLRAVLSARVSSMYAYGSHVWKILYTVDFPIYL